MPQRRIDTVIGPVRLTSESGRLASISIYGPPASDMPGDEDILGEAQAQLEAYFAGRRDGFDLPLVPCHTDRGSMLRNAICSIPAGMTMTYGELARRVGSSPRAIGQACARNPLPIVVPCHRIVASNGLGHYSGGQGVVTKGWLLAHESKEKLLWEL